jgi:hypothetical protein
MIDISDAAPDLVEKAARVQYERDGGSMWDRETEPAREEYRDDARAVLVAAGLPEALAEVRALRGWNDNLGTEHMRLEEAYGVQANLLDEALAEVERRRDGLREAHIDLATALGQVQRVEALLARSKPMSGDFWRLTGGYATEADALSDLYGEDFVRDLRAALADPTDTTEEKR